MAEVNPITLSDTPTPASGETKGLINASEQLILGGEVEIDEGMLLSLIDQFVKRGKKKEWIAKRLGLTPVEFSQILHRARKPSADQKRHVQLTLETQKLKKEVGLESAYLHLLLSGYHIGVDNPLRQKDAAAMLGVDPRQIRKAKRALRRSGMAICERTWGKKRGDFLAANPEEWQRYFERPFRGRALDILVTYRRGLEEAKKKFGEVVPIDGILAHVKQFEVALQEQRDVAQESG